MNLIRKTNNDWDPFDMITDLQSDLNHIFNRSLSRRGGLDWGGGPSPAVEIREEQEQFLVHADLPGMKKEDFSVTVESNVLTLKGERKFEKETKEKAYYFSERSYGSFQRTIQLPSEVQSDKIRATYKDGVLEIVLPKSEHAKPKQVSVDVK